MCALAPCHVVGCKPNPCAVAVHEQRTYGKAELGGPWKGWRLAGRCLVTPEGLKLPLERVKGLAWRQDAEDRFARAKARNAARANDGQLVKVVVVTLTEFRAERAGAA